MAFTGSAMCTSFKVELLEAGHDFRLVGGHSFYAALYDSTASLTAATTAYTTTGEVVGAGYVAGGALLTRVSPTSAGTTAFPSFANISWAAATISARGMLIYNKTPTAGLSLTNPAVAVIDFGAVYSSTAGTFTVTFPAAGATTAIVRIG